MDLPSAIEITDELSIPLSELDFATSRSSGPGGQHVNKVETRVTLVFDVAASGSLDEEQKVRLFERLSSRVNKRGELRISADRHRSQAANKRLVVERFAELVGDALARRRRRRRTRVPAAARRRRLEAKRRRSEVKRGRRTPRIDD